MREAGATRPRMGRRLRRQRPTGRDVGHSRRGRPLGAGGGCHQARPARDAGGHRVPARRPLGGEDARRALTQLTDARSARNLVGRGWSSGSRRAHNPKVGSSNLSPATNPLTTRESRLRPGGFCVVSGELGPLLEVAGHVEHEWGAAGVAEGRAQGLPPLGRRSPRWPGYPPPEVQGRAGWVGHPRSDRGRRSWGCLAGGRSGCR